MKLHLLLNRLQNVAPIRKRHQGQVHACHRFQLVRSSSKRIGKFYGITQSFVFSTSSTHETSGIICHGYGYFMRRLV